MGPVTYGAAVGVSGLVFGLPSLFNGVWAATASLNTSPHAATALIAAVAGAARKWKKSPLVGLDDSRTVTADRYAFLTKMLIFGIVLVVMIAIFLFMLVL